MRVRLFLALVAGASLSSPAFTYEPEGASGTRGELTRYTIGMAREGVAHIQIDHTLANGVVYIRHSTAADGTTTDDFISNATISGTHGTAPMEPLGNGGWSTSAAAIGDRVLIEYDLRLGHGDHAWAHGREEIGFKLGDGAFLVSRTTLLADYGDQNSPIEVAFDAEDSAAPWTPIGHNLWRADDLDSFLNNCFTFGSGFGRFIAETEQGNVTFIHDEASTDLAKQAARDIAPALQHITAIFGSFPASNFHIFLFENDHPEGGAYDDSFAMLHPVPAQQVDALLWRQGFIHEINHLWVGHAIRPANQADIEWFKEGVADYLAIKTMWKLGYLEDHTLEGKLANLMRRHTLGVFMSRGQVGLTEAGANKSENMMIIYGSGATWSFMLDVEMAAHQGPGAFERMLRDLYEHSEKPYTQARLMERINVTSNGAAGRLLAQFERNLMPMAFPAMLEPYGMELAFMIPDMFELDLNPRRLTGVDRLPAFLRDAE